MQRRLLRDGEVVDDEWLYLEEVADLSAADSRRPAALIIPLERWLQDKAAWTGLGGRLGVLLAPAHRIEQLVEDLPLLSLVAADFPTPSEGRGYSQARLLRERCKFRGEVRARGHVRRDQLFFMARCGFNAFELPEGELAAARAALGTFTAAYQPANDAGLYSRLRHR